MFLQDTKGLWTFLLWWSWVKWWHFRVMAFVFPRSCSTCWALLLWKWLNASLLWEVTNGFMVWFCLYTHLLLCLVNCPYLSPWVLTLSPLRFSPPSHPGTVSKWLCGAELPGRAKPQHKQTNSWYLSSNLYCRLFERHVPSLNTPSGWFVKG